MAAETPPFWWQPPGLMSALMWPLSLAYIPIARRRFRLQGRDVVDVPVLCVANLAIGASGKTPVAIALADAARHLGLKPGFVSRGPAGTPASAHLVDAAHDSARHVGAEALELALHAPVAVSSRHASGARALAAEGCDVIILLDGFAGARILIDYVLVVVEAQRGLGNGRVVPAGPVRAPLTDQLRHADGAVILGEGRAADPVIRFISRAGRPVYEAKEVPARDAGLDGQRVLAFSGLSAPAHFHAMLREAGAEIVAHRNFGARHHYRGEEIAELRSRAGREELQLVTTRRDSIALANGKPAIREILPQCKVLDIEVAFEHAEMPLRIIGDTLGAWERRHARA